MPKLKIDKYILIFAAALSVCALELFFLLPLEFKKISSTNKKIAKIKSDIETIEKDWPHKDDYLKYSAQIQTEIESVYDKFIVPQAESSLFSFISSESKKFGIEIKVLKPLGMEDYASTKSAKFKYLPISIKAQGQFHNLGKFLESLQSGKHFFEIKELKIKSDYPEHEIDMIICGLIKE